MAGAHRPMREADRSRSILTHQDMGMDMGGMDMSGTNADKGKMDGMSHGMHGMPAMNASARKTTETVMDMRGAPGHGSNGSGLSDIGAGVRLRYEIRREFAPYIGVNWTHLYGRTADYAREEGENTDTFQILVGISAWF